MIKKFTFFATAVTLFLLFGCRNESVLETSKNQSKPTLKVSVIKNNEILTDLKISRELDKIILEKFSKNLTGRNVQDSVLEGAQILTENVMLVEAGAKKLIHFQLKETIIQAKLRTSSLKKMLTVPSQEF